MRIVFTEDGDKHWEYWKKNNPQKIKKIKLLIEDIIDHPYTGIGHPEPLKYELSGKWARRITKEHRLVYEVTSDGLVIYQCRFHY
ncbi:MAG: Txe/YoeB family addiction module toxin [Rhodospirillaceae bacterium]|nr:Txe/YoeB family addiction module toxin [Rhodospirillaceae bacterium]